MKRLGYWAASAVIALDILFASLVGAHHGETVSHYAARHLDTWGGPVCAILDVVDPGHCARVTY